MRRQETAARFQSTRPRGARPAVCVMTMATDLFQSTRPRGARHGVSQFIAAAQQFQSTRPRGARRSAHMSSIGERCFNPRAHEGRDRHLRAKCYIWDLFQSTRPRGARHVRLRREVLRRPVSIHAPTRGATWRSSYAGTPATCFNPRAHEGRDLGKAQGGGTADRFQSTRPRGARRGRDGACQHGGRVSIHAPTRGATRGRGAGTRTRGCFNPRAHEGRDSPPSPVSSARCPVSIHAPTRGATPYTSTPAYFGFTFQSTRPRGARPLRDGRERVGTWFQSTRPRGARPPCLASTTTPQPSFNPRAHEGRDDQGHGLEQGHEQVSIHAPTRGATAAHGPADRLEGVSIHAPTRGATRPSMSRLPSSCRFNPRAHEGRDAELMPLLPTWRCFNPRAHEGRDPVVMSGSMSRHGFNPRAHEGRDHRASPKMSPTACFNPRAHEGRDLPRWENRYSFSSFNPRAHEGRD